MLNNSDGAPALTPTDWPSRPPGHLIWLHCPTHKGLISIAKIIERLEEGGTDITVVLTADTLPAEAPHPAFIMQPIEALTNPRTFVRHWQPDILIWLGGPLVPAYLTALDPFETKRIFLNASDENISRTPAGWFRTSRRSLFRRFDVVLATDAPSATRLRRYGTPPTNIENIGILDDPHPAPTVDETALGEIGEALKTRPVWLAFDPHVTEIKEILRAHKQASRGAHRLLLIVAQSDKDESCYADSGMHIAFESKGDPISDATQIFVTEGLDRKANWLRLSPITFIGGSLSEASRLDPFDPASLGSAIIHGPETAPYGPKFERLVSANASTQITQTQELPASVEDLLAANINAEQASRAWSIISEGAEVAKAMEATLTSLLANRSAA